MNNISKRGLWLVSREKIIKHVAKALDIKFFPKQHEIIYDPAQYKIMRAARRSSKSFNVAFTIFCVLYFAGFFNVNVKIKIAGPHTDDVRNIWEHFWKFWKKLPLSKQFKLLKTYYSNKNSNAAVKQRLTFNDSCWIKTVSCDSLKGTDIRGDALDLVACDEFGNVPHKDLFLSSAVHSLKDKGNLNLMMIVGTADLTKDLGQTFNRLFTRGQEGNPKVKSWTMRYQDNPHHDEESAKLAHSLETDDGLLREVEGENVSVTGRMFKDFNFRHPEVVRPITFNPNLPYNIGMDVGRNKPYFCYFQYDPITGKVYVLREVSKENVLIDQILEEVALDVITIYKTSPLTLGVDRASKNHNDLVSWTTYDKIKKAFSMVHFVKGGELVSKQNQVFALRLLMRQNRLIIDPSCKMLLSSITTATPDVSLLTGQINSAGWKKVNGIDDPLDGLCYGLINYGPTSELFISKRGKSRMMSAMEAQMVGTSLGLI